MPKTDHSTSGIISTEMRAALVVAHPGHELCLYGWLKRVRPRVFVLTDGSGHSSISRIKRTTNILEELGAEAGSFYGRFSDVVVYEALLNHQFDLFISLARELAREIINQRIDCIVGDAREGYNPSHDICRLVIDAAVEMAGRASGRKIDNLQFFVTGRPDARPNMPHAQPTCLHLDEATFEQKLTATRNYPELKDEIEAFISAYSAESFRSEYLYRVTDCNGDGFPGEACAYYEQHGGERVKQDYYKQVIRYHEHVSPVEAALRECVKEIGHEQIAGSDYDL